MSTLSLSKKKKGAAAVPDAVAKGAEEAASKVSDAVELAGARVSKAAAKANTEAAAKTTKAAAKTTKAAAKQTREAAKSRFLRRPTGDALLKAQLVKTSRDLAHESSDLNEAVDSLNAIIRANRKAGATGRTKLLGGLTLGAVIMYHLDPEHGRRRRAATARAIGGFVRGNG